MQDLGLHRNSLLAELRPCSFPHLLHPENYIHLHPGASLHIWVPANSLHSFKVQPAWEAEGLSLQGLCHFCEVLLVLNFPQSKWKHPWTHASQPACLRSRTNDCTVQGGESEPKHDSVSVCPGSQVLVSLRTIHKTVVLYLKNILLKAKLWKFAEKYL